MSTIFVLPVAQALKSFLCWLIPSSYLFVGFGSRTLEGFDITSAREETLTDMFKTYEIKPWQNATEREPHV